MEIKILTVKSKDLKQEKRKRETVPRVDEVPQILEDCSNNVGGGVRGYGQDK